MFGDEKLNSQTKRETCHKSTWRRFAKK